VGGCDDVGERVRRVLELAPVRDLRLLLEDWDGSLDGAGPGLGRLVELHLSLTGSLGTDASFPEVFESGGLAGLKSFLLDCEGCEVSPVQLAEVFGSGVLPGGLLRLGIHQWEDAFREEDLEILDGLVGAAHLAGLRALHLLFFALDEHADRLADCPAFSSLDELDLRRCAAQEAGWRRLLWSPRLDRLTSLDLTDARLSDGGADFHLHDRPLAGDVRRRFPDAAFDTPIDEERSQLSTWQGERW
jgi:hypothetical protein